MLTEQETVILNNFILVFKTTSRLLVRGYGSFCLPHLEMDVKIIAKEMADAGYRHEFTDALDSELMKVVSEYK